MVARHKVDESKIYQGEMFDFVFGKHTNDLTILTKHGKPKVILSLYLTEYDKEMLMYGLLGHSNIPDESFLIKVMKNVVDNAGERH